MAALQTTTGQTLADRVLLALKERGMSQTTLENAAKLGRGAASKIVSGERVDLRTKTLTKIAEALNVSFDWLSRGVGEMNATRNQAGPMSVQPKMVLAHLPNLNVCIAFHRVDRWEGWTVAAAQAGFYPDDVQPEEWVARLDRLQSALSHARKKH